MQLKTISAVLVCLLIACQGPSTPDGPTGQTTGSAQNLLPPTEIKALSKNSGQGVNPVKAQPVIRYLPKAVPFGKVEPLPPTVPQQRDLRVKITYPQNLSDFKTQAFGCDEVAHAKIWVAGAGMNTVYADGSDPVTNLINTTGCEITATLSNVPYGTRVVSIELYDDEQHLLTGSVLKAPLRLSSGSQSIELSYRQWLAGRLLERMRGTSLDAEFISGQMDLAALQTLIDTITGVGGSFPNYSFVNHPALINQTTLLNDILAANGNLSGLSAGPQYVQTAGSLRFNLAGYLINQDVDISIDDAMSPNAVASANGQVTLTNVPPGQWYLRLSGPGYLTTRVAVTVNANQQANRGTETIYPPQATLTGISPSSGGRNLSINLSGSNFNSTIANNIVRFGSTQATVTAASSTSLSVTVPNSLTVGSHPVSVTIGAANAATGHSFSVVAPVISSLSANTGSSGNSITLTGTGFSDTDADNTVYFGSTAGTLVSVTATEIVVQVPEGPAGSAPIRVETHGLSSNSTSFTRLPYLGSVVAAQSVAGKAALIRSHTITLNGSNFDNTPANNQVRFTLSNSTLVTATPVTASATQLTVVVPAGVSVPGDVAVIVRSNSQNSSAVTALVPSINLDFNGGFQ